MEYQVIVQRVCLEQANAIVKILSGMGFGVPDIVEVPEPKEGDVKKRKGIGVVMVENGEKFISISSATDWLRKNCNITCSDSGLKQAIERGESYHGFKFEFDSDGGLGL